MYDCQSGLLLTLYSIVNTQKWTISPWTWKLASRLELDGLRKLLPKFYPLLYSLNKQVQGFVVVVVVVCFVFCLFFVVVAVDFFSSEKPSMSEDFRCTNIPLREGLQEILRNKRAYICYLPAGMIYMSWRFLV